MVVEILLGVLGLGVAWAASGLRVVRQWERAVVFRFGQVQPAVRGPGLTRITPIRDRLRKVSMQIVTMPVPGQDGITRDNVTVRVDAVVYFRVEEPITAIVAVQDYLFAVEQVAQTSLRSIIGKSDLDDLLSNRESLNKGLELLIDSPALGWGIHIERVEIKDVALPETMKRSMSRQAEAERERRARIITADGEYQASQKLSQAAEIMSNNPAALQLRLLETVVQVAAEKNSTLVLPFPVELLRFLERATPSGEPEPAPAARSDDTPADPAIPPPRSSDAVPPRRDDPALTVPDRGPAPSRRGTDAVPSGGDDLALTVPDGGPAPSRRGTDAVPSGGDDPALTVPDGGPAPSRRGTDAVLSGGDDPAPPEPGTPRPDDVSTPARPAGTTRP
jgi:regulator of protease activity HflC (stomatin/prohibitin superfamily)